MTSSRIVEASCLVALLLLSGIASTLGQQKSMVPPPAQSNSKPSFSERYPRYQLRSGDSFDIGFEYSPEFNQSVTVQPDGFISLREIGDVQVSGLTLPEVKQVLEAKYAGILKQPNISLTPKDFEKSYFIAVGEVGRPGKYELRDQITVTEAVAIAGGFSQDRAKHSEIVLFRREGNTLAAGKVIDVKKMLAKKNLSEDEYVRPGDLIYVPQNGWSKMRQLIPTPGVGMQAGTF
jgi:polysaccharide biosynthesis/export protein